MSEHVKRCVKALKEALDGKKWSDTLELMDGYEAIFELMPQDWIETPEGTEDWVEGYEQCLLDIVDAIADEWGVTLPPFERGS